MVRTRSERVLIIGDGQRQVRAALAAALPTAQIVEVSDYFDGIGEVGSGAFTAVLAAAEPIERRPEAAVRTLRSLAGDARLVLFGHPTLEPLSRKMLEFGCDDYIITPTSPGELHQIFGAARLRIAPAASDASSPQSRAVEARGPSRLEELPLADILLSALTTHPHDAVMQAVAELNRHLGPAMQLMHLPLKSPPPAAKIGRAHV